MVEKMDLWKQYLYQEHTESELREWASRLRFFRYFRAYGGHANDGDSLDVALRYESTEALIGLLESIGIHPVVYEEKPDQPVPGINYSHEEYISFPNLIPNTQWIKQPSHCELLGGKVFVWCNGEIINISSSAGSYVVTNDHVELAEKIEPKLEGFKHLIVDPPKDTNHYICPKYYPGFYS